VLLHGVLEVAVCGPGGFLEAVFEQFWPHERQVPRRAGQVEVRLIVGRMRSDALEHFPRTPAETRALRPSPEVTTFNPS
jgi:hypothetical protein